MAKRGTKILFAGGGTLGPVTPLLAIAEVWQKQDKDAQFVWVGTKNGPERANVRAAGIEFLYLPVARLTRYPSLEWLLLPFNFLSACFIANLVLGREKPQLIASAGGFTGVPVILAAWLRGIPCWIHQQDAPPLLANRLVAPFVKCITVAWKSSLKDFPQAKTEWLGNPVRPSVLEGKKDKAHDIFGIDLKKPTVLIFGGGGGSVWINHMLETQADWLIKETNVIHVTGKGKMTKGLENHGTRYRAVEFLDDEMAHALAAADVVIARAGMGTITELAALKKATVFIPLPNSPQEENAKRVKETEAGLVLEQHLATTGDLKAQIKKLLNDPDLRREYGGRLHTLLPTDIAEDLVEHLKIKCLK